MARAGRRQRTSKKSGSGSSSGTSSSTGTGSRMKLPRGMISRQRRKPYERKLVSTKKLEVPEARQRKTLLSEQIPKLKANRNARLAARLSRKGRIGAKSLPLHSIHSGGVITSRPSLGGPGAKPPGVRRREPNLRQLDVATVPVDTTVETKDRATCKQRPTDSRGKGNSRRFIPWCNTRS